MGLRALGDSAWLFEAGGSDERARLELVMKLLNILERERIPQVTDVVSSFASVAVHFDPSDGETVLSWLTRLPPPTPEDGTRMHARTIEVPVLYGGADLENVAAALGRSQQEVVGMHHGADYTVAAIGFSPGFPYLLGLPPELHLPRLVTPRKVDAGTVAIAGKQAGIYPCASQGGWHGIGRTSLRLFDPEADAPSLLRPGNRVRFTPVERLESITRIERPCLESRGGFEVIDAGPLTSVQDRGRPGLQAFGISPGGAADPVAMRVVNRLVGNPDDAAVLEYCMSGPVLRFHETVRVAWTGSGKPVLLHAGDELDLRGRMNPLRGYLAVAGGINAPEVLGSRATDLRAGFGGWRGRYLQAGDRLPIGVKKDGPSSGDWRVGWPRHDRGPVELRFLTGMQAAWFTDAAHKQFTESFYQISPNSDRMGLRMTGPLLEREDTSEMVSQPVVAGSVQVPPDGQPIVLMCERQTIGGYPQIGHVISADLPKLARAWPGTKLRFREVTLEEARAAWRELELDFRRLQAGLGFLR